MGALVGVTSVVGLLLLPASGVAGRANAGLAGAPPSNPLAGVRWGNYHSPTVDPTNDAPSAYYNLTGDPTYGAILGQPRFRWFGPWNPIRDQDGGEKPGARNVVRYFIRTVRRGDPEVGVQVAAFRLVPWGHAACRRLPTRGERRAFRRWTREFAKGVGAARTALVLQPDMPFARCAPGRSRWATAAVAWAARLFGRLPRTTVYIDAGAADWAPARAMATMLRRSGIRHVRGFALNVTHYDSTARQVVYGRKILRRLRRSGIRGKGFVVNTAQNGRPFRFQRAPRAFKSGLACADDSSRRCTALGLPPTTSTGQRGVDAYLWIGRPWLANTRVRGPGELLSLIRSSPHF